MISIHFTYLLMIFCTFFFFSFFFFFYLAIDEGMFTPGHHPHHQMRGMPPPHGMPHRPHPGMSPGMGSHPGMTPPNQQYQMQQAQSPYPNMVQSPQHGGIPTPGGVPPPGQGYTPGGPHPGITPPHGMQGMHMSSTHYPAPPSALNLNLAGLHQPHGLVHSHAGGAGAVVSGLTPHGIGHAPPNLGVPPGNLIKHGRP